MTYKGWPVGAVLIAVALSITGCASNRLSTAPIGEEAYRIAPPRDPQATAQSYVISAGDLLSLQVFQEPDISNESLQVDDSGNIQMPLIGEVPAAGRTVAALAADVAERLGRRFIVNPQVVVQVVKASAQIVTVEGEVQSPGVYEITRDYTLLSAIARAQSPKRTARLDQVVIFREVNGQALAARFDLRDIRAGRAPDPRILGGDRVVVGYSSSARAWQDILQALPVLNVFAILR